MLNRKGQSAMEMALFGTLIIAAFSFIIMFGERINRQQSYIMQGFRESMIQARSLKGPVTYTKSADRRMPNVANPMTLGNQETFSSDSNIMWGNRFDELDQAHTFYKINDASLIEVTQTLSVSIAGGGGSGASITPIVSNGVITGFTIVSGGSGYTSAPTITFIGGGGTGATATVTVSGGVVTAVTVTSGGSGYTAAPSGPVTEVSTTQQTTHAENTQSLTKSPGADSISTKVLRARDTLVESSPNYNKTFYLGPGGKYYVDPNQEMVRSGTVYNGR